MDEDLYAVAYEAILDELSCPVCRETFTQPKTLQCGHVFCSSCLGKVVKSHQYTDTLTCPTCRRATILTSNGVDGLPSNYHLANLIDRLNQTQQADQSLTGTSDQQALASLTCDKHTEKTLDLFCDNCDIGICALCFVENHRDHPVKGMQEKIEKSMETLRGLAIDSHHNLEQTSKTIETLKAEKKTLNQHKEKVLRDVSSYFQVLHETVTSRETLICETITKYYQLKLSAADRILMPLETEFLLLSQNVVEMKAKRNSPLSSIKAMTQTVSEKNETVSQLLEQAGQQEFCQEFLSFSKRENVRAHISEIGELNECVVLEKSNSATGSVAIEAFKVKKKLSIRQESTTRIRFESSNSLDDIDDDGEELYETPPDLQAANTTQQDEVARRKESTTSRCPPVVPAGDEDMYDDTASVGGYIQIENQQQQQQQQGGLLKPPLPPRRPKTPDDIPRPCSVVVEENATYLEHTTRQNAGNSQYENIATATGVVLKPIKTFGNRLQALAWNLKDPPQPWGIAVSHSLDKIYISDTGNCCVLVITADGRLSKLIGTQGRGNGQFQMPVDVALDEKSNLYVADRINGTVQKFDYRGKFKLRFKQAEAPGDIAEPNGIAVFRNKVFVSDRVHGKIVVFNPQTGSYLTTIFPLKKVGDNPFQPAAIAIHPRFEKIYVTDRCNHQVLVFNNDGDHIDTIGSKGRGEGQLQFPNGIAITANDQLLVTETENHRVSIFDSNTGRFIRSFGRAGEEEGMFIIPRHLAINIHNEVYITDQNNHRIQVFKLGNTVEEEDPYTYLGEIDPPHIYQK